MAKGNGSVRAFGDTSGASVDTSGFGGNKYVSPTKVQGRQLTVLNWTFGDSQFGYRCFVNAVDNGEEITIPLSDKSPAFYQLKEMGASGDTEGFTGTLIPNGKSFEWA